MTVIPVQKVRRPHSVLLQQVEARLGLFVLAYLALMFLGMWVVILVPGRYEARVELEVTGPDGMPRTMSVLSNETYRDEVLKDEVFILAQKELSGQVSGTETSTATGPNYELLRRLRQSVSVSTIPDKALVIISAGSGSPREAERFANAMARAYVRVRTEAVRAIRARHEPDLNRRAELEGSVKTLTVERDSAKTALTVFDEASRTDFGHDGNLVAARTNLETQLRQVQTEWGDARVQVEGLTGAVTRLDQELSRTEEFILEETVTIMPNPERQALQTEIAQLERELSAMLLRLTERHPEVIEKREIIKQKKADLERMDRRVDDTTTRGRKPNPVYVQMRNNLDQTRVRLQQAEYAVKQKTADEERLRGRLTDLDLRVTQRNILVDRLSTAQTRVDEAAKELNELNVKVGALEAGLVVPNLVKEAGRPEVPAGPYRGVWTVPVFVLAVLGAMGATFALPLVDRTFASVYEVERSLDLPVVATVSRIESPSQRKTRLAVRRSLLVLTAALLVTGLALTTALTLFPSLMQSARLFIFKS